MKSPVLKRIIHKIGLEFWLTDAQVTEVIMSQFKFLKHIITKGDKHDVTYYNFRLPKFGVFSVSEGRKNWEKKRIENEGNKDIHSGGGEQKPE
jgi:hypothetical protein